MSLFKNLYEDDALLAIDKPSGMLVIPDRWQKEKGQSALELLEKKLKIKIFVVHRLDRDTSGVIIFAKNKEAHRLLSLAFEHREVQKIYYGLVHGCPPEKDMEIHKAIEVCRHDPQLRIVHDKGKPSVTRLEVLESFQEYSWLKLMPQTGRTHQIRVHLASIGCPLVCDKLYGLINDEIYLSKLKRRYLFKRNEIERPLLSRLALHAERISFLHPVTQESFEIVSPLPKDLKACVEQMKKMKK